MIDLLSERHAKDVFVPECKMGSTWGSGGTRLDAWALKKTWSPVTAIGYEIKESRGDFLRDEKWPAYLPMCHQFYFVSPHGMIQPEELPENVGLLWSTKTRTRLYTKRKAPRREVELPTELMAYVLMSRVRIVANMDAANGHRSGDDRRARTERWARWLEDKELSTKIGYQVRGRIREKLRDFDTEIQSLTARIERFAHIEKRLVELGFDPKSHVGTWAVESQLKRHGDQELHEHLDRAWEALNEARRALR